MVTDLQVSKYTALAGPNPLYDSESWTLKEQDKSGITVAEMKFVRKRAKLTLFSRKINQAILREDSLKHDQQ